MKARFLMIAGLALTASACEPKAPADVAATPVEAGNPAETVADLGKAFPAAFRGKWDANAETCKTGSEHKVFITETEMQFWESSGVLKSIAQDGANAVKVAAAFSGEGETWDATMRLELSAAGDTLTLNDDKANPRVRCS